MDTFFRRVCRWHFWAGLFACPVQFVVAFTGVLYRFCQEIKDWQRSPHPSLSDIAVDVPVLFVPHEVLK